MAKRCQRLDLFSLPADFRGRSAFVVQLWWLVDSLLFRPSPQFAYGFRRLLLRAFGAKVGARVLIRPSVRVTYPWKFQVGDYSWIGDDVVIYSLGKIAVGAHSVVSQGTYLCAGDHDYAVEHFPIRSRPITIGDQAWVGAQCFVAPGVSVGSGSVVGARSVVLEDLGDGVVAVGHPCKVISKRASWSQS